MVDGGSFVASIWKKPFCLSKQHAPSLSFSWCIPNEDLSATMFMIPILGKHLLESMYVDVLPLTIAAIRVDLFLVFGQVNLVY